MVLVRVKFWENEFKSLFQCTFRLLNFINRRVVLFQHYHFQISGVQSCNVLGLKYQRKFCFFCFFFPQRKLKLKYSSSHLIIGLLVTKILENKSIILAITNQCFYKSKFWMHFKKFRPTEIWVSNRNFRNFHQSSRNFRAPGRTFSRFSWALPTQTQNLATRKKYFLHLCLTYFTIKQMRLHILTIP